MSAYKVKIGDKIVPVEGLPGLIRLVQSGGLKPEDPVFIPSTGKWHYARAVRQLRGYFSDPIAAPPPASGSDGGSAEAKPDAPEAAAVAEVVPFRRGRWQPEGKGVDVPVFNYDVDLEPPPLSIFLRVAFIVGASLAVGGMIYLYIVGYDSYLFDKFENPADLGPPRIVSLDRERPSAAPAPGSSGEDAGVAPGETQVEIPAEGAGGPRANRTTMPAATAMPIAKATPAVPTFDAAAALRKVRTARLASASTPAELGPAIERDLLGIAVPLRSARFEPARKAGKKAVPFIAIVEYAPEGEFDANVRAKHRFMILAMVGRRISEVRMNVEIIRFRTAAGGKVAEIRIPAEMARRLATGAAGPADLEELFAPQ